MKRSDPNWDEYIIRNSLRQICYCLERFDISRDVDHLDNAERHAEAVRPYLPACWHDLDLRSLRDLYLYSPSLHQS
jgi:hypothetical protein